MHRRSILLSFRDAFRGIGHVIWTQRNARIQCLLGIAAFVMAAALRLPARDWALITLTIAVVLASEAGNTVVETLVDLVCPGPSETARIAKDASAGAVLLIAIGAAAVGLLVFGPPLWRLIGAYSA